MDSIEDPVFGKLFRDGLYWQREYELFIFGEKRTSILIAGNDAGPTSEQQKIFIKFDKNKEQCIKKIEQSIYAYYLSILEGTRADFGDVADEYMPIISTMNELGALIPLEEIIIRDPYYNEDKIIALLFGCTWDDSHGLGVELTDNEVTNVGLQDIVL